MSYRYYHRLDGFEIGVRVLMFVMALALAMAIVFVVTEINEAERHAAVIRSACVLQRIERRPATCYRSETTFDVDGTPSFSTEPYDCERVFECYLCDGGEECF